MTGFKEGAETDPLGDAEDEDPDAQPDSSEETLSLDADDFSRNLDQSDSNGIPWIYERGNYTDGREKTVQLHLQQHTTNKERELVAALERTLGESVQKADVREAAYLVAMNHVDDIANQLREWGYDY